MRLCLDDKSLIQFDESPKISFGALGRQASDSMTEVHVSQWIDLITAMKSDWFDPVSRSLSANHVSTANIGSFFFYLCELFGLSFVCVPLADTDLKVKTLKETEAHSFMEMSRRALQMT